MYQNEISYIIDVKNDDVDFNNQQIFDIYSANKLWRDYWQVYYKNQYSHDNLVQENEEMRARLIKTTNDINKLLVAYKKIFEENISLGKRIDDLKTNNRELNFTIIDLKQRYKEDVEKLKDDTTLGIGFKVFQQVKKNKDLEEKISELENRPSLFESVADKDPNIFDKIAELYIKGFKQKDIAEKLNISAATVSRYLNKSEMQKKLQALHSNATSSKTI